MGKVLGFGNDSIVVQNFLSGIPGGRMLNMEGYAEEVVYAGHIIIKKAGEYKPMPVKDGAYYALPEGYSYCGMLQASITKAEPFAAIMTQGQALEGALPYSIEGIKAALKTALPALDFINE